MTSAGFCILVNTWQFHLTSCLCPQPAAILDSSPQSSYLICQQMPGAPPSPCFHELTCFSASARLATGLVQALSPGLFGNLLPDLLSSFSFFPQHLLLLLTVCLPHWDRPLHLKENNVISCSHSQVALILPRVCLGLESTACCPFPGSLMPLPLPLRLQALRVSQTRRPGSALGSSHLSPA